MTEAKVVVRTGSITEVVALSNQLPEFNNPHSEAEYERRLLHGVNHLILVAEVNGKVVGFKVGYERDTDGSFYSWMGGVLPAWRRKQVALKLAQHQEAWAKAQGYDTIRCKTLNRHRSMLLFAIRRSFNIIAVIPGVGVAENRIMLEKQL